MSAETDILSQRLREIRQRMLDQSAGRLQEILTQLQSADRGTISAAERERAYILIHNFAGTAGSVGLEELGRAAKTLEQIVGPWLRGGQGEIPAWTKAFEALTQAVVSERDRET